MFPIGGDRMRLVDDSVLGVIVGRALVLNAHEIATVRRAQTIVDEVRDRMRAHLGDEVFEGSCWYTLGVADAVDVSGEFSLDVLGMGV